jgi:hypothetical protein
MKMQLAAATLCLLISNAVVFAQAGADRASTRTDTTRANTEGRFNALESNQVEKTQREVVQERIITVPAQKRTKPNAGLAVETAKPKTKRIAVRRVETVEKPAPLKINPF